MNSTATAKRTRERGYIRTQCEHARVLIHAAPPECGIWIAREVGEGHAIVVVGEWAPEGVDLTPHMDYTITITGIRTWVSDTDVRYTQGLPIPAGHYRVHTSGGNESPAQTTVWLENIKPQRTDNDALIISARNGQWRATITGHYAGETRNMDDVSGCKAVMEFAITPGAHIKCEAPGHAPWTVHGRDGHTKFEIVRTGALGLIAVRYPDDHGADGGMRLPASS